jgi:hypothetical protein
MFLKNFCFVSAQAKSYIMVQSKGQLELNKNQKPHQVLQRPNGKFATS